MDQFLELHPKDQALYFLSYNKQNQMDIINSINPEILADFFMHFDEEEAAKIFAKYNINIIVNIINEMNADDVTRIFRYVDPITRNKYLSLLDKIHAQQIREILQYDEDTAGGIMEKSFLYIKSKHTVKKAKEILIELAPTIENINYLYILTSKYELIGVVSLKELLIAPDSLVVTELMTTDLKTVDVNADVITAASVVRDYDFYALPVINQNNQIQGIITVDDIIDVISEEARENIEQISGITTDASETHFWANVGLRLPWLVLLLFMTMFNAKIISGFDGVIKVFPILASYMTLVAAMSGNVGTQSLGMTIYRLSQDENFDDKKKIVKYVANELRVYIVIGICLSLLILLTIGVFGNNIRLAITLCLTIIITFSISTFLGTVIPITLDKMKINSQVASGPLITTINDLIAVVTFLSLGWLLM